MISSNGIEYIKGMCETQSDMISGGVIYVITDRNSITWRKASSEFDLDIFQIGEKLKPDSISGKAMKENKIIIENVPRSLYGRRLKIVSEPILNDEGLIVGAFSTIFPVIHPVVHAFKDFAPILSEMFSDGAVLMTTDLNSFIDIQNSKEFQLPQIKEGNRFSEGSPADIAIKTKKTISKEYDASVYGVPVLSICHPLFDENTGQTVATFNLVIPKVTAANLKDMAINLENDLTGIASTIEELAASASNIHVNEQELNNNISEITQLSKEINDVSAFIRKIADETKMLGLNAAIEAARAGNAGRGFGVVAEEIRKLSEQSKSTVPKIQKLTDEIIAKVTESKTKSESSLSSSQEQAAATEEITASIEAITSMAERLNEYARKL